MIITSKEFVSVDHARAFYLESLNEAIDAVRDRYYASGFFIAEEYRLVVEDALEFKRNDFKEEVPPMIVIHAQAMQVSPEEATERILMERALLDFVLQETCRARLLGRAVILVAKTVTQMRDAHDKALTSLSELPDPQPL